MAGGACSPAMLHFFHVAPTRSHDIPSPHVDSQNERVRRRRLERATHACESG